MNLQCHSVEHREDRVMLQSDQDGRVHFFFQPSFIPLTPNPSLPSSREVNCESYFFKRVAQFIFHMFYKYIFIFMYLHDIYKHKKQYRMELPYYRQSEKLIFSKGSLWPDRNTTGQTKNCSPLIFCPTRCPVNSVLIPPVLITLFSLYLCITISSI